MDRTLQRRAARRRRPRQARRAGLHRFGAHDPAGGGGGEEEVLPGKGIRVLGPATGTKLHRWVEAESGRFRSTRPMPGGIPPADRSESPLWTSEPPCTRKDVRFAHIYTDLRVPLKAATATVLPPRILSLREWSSVPRGPGRFLPGPGSRPRARTCPVVFPSSPRSRSCCGRNGAGVCRCR